MRLKPGGAYAFATASWAPARSVDAKKARRIIGPVNGDLFLSLFVLDIDRELHVCALSLPLLRIEVCVDSVVVGRPLLPTRYEYVLNAWHVILLHVNRNDNVTTWIKPEAMLRS